MKIPEFMTDRELQEALHNTQQQLEGLEFNLEYARLARETRIAELKLEIQARAKNKSESLQPA